MPSNAPRCEEGQISPIKVEPSVKITLAIEKAVPTRKIFSDPNGTSGRQIAATPAITTHVQPRAPRERRLGYPAFVSRCDRNAQHGAMTICIREGRTMIHAAVDGAR